MRQEPFPNNHTAYRVSPLRRSVFSGANNATFIALSLLILLVAFALRLFNAAERSLWYDETATMIFSRQTIPWILNQILVGDSNTPLYYIIMHYWVRLAGQSELSGRLLSIFPGVLTVAVATQLIAQLQRKQRITPSHNRFTGLIAMLLTALWPVGLYISQELRPYALAVLFSTAGLWLMLLCYKRPTHKRRWVMWAIVNALAFLSHIIAILPLAAQCIVFGIGLWRQRKTSATYGPLAIMALTALVLGFGLIAILTLSPRIRVAEALPFTQIVTEIVAANFLPRLLPEPWIVATAVIGAILLIVALTRFPALALVVLMYWVFIALASSASANTGARFAIFLYPIMPSLIVALISVWPVWIRRGFLALCLLPCLMGSAAWHTDPRYANDDYRGAITYIYRNVAPSEVVLAIDGYIGKTIEYYKPDAPFSAIPPPGNTMPMNLSTAASVINQSIVGKTGVWLLRWHDQDRDPAGIVMSYIRKHAVANTNGQIPGFHGLIVEHYLFATPFETIDPTIPTIDSEIAPIGPDVGLASRGCHLDHAVYSTDRRIDLTCYWKGYIQASLPWDTQVSMRLVDANNNTLMQRDQILAPTVGMPTGRYQEDFPVFYTLETNPLPPGDYKIVIIPYTAAGEIRPRLTTRVSISSPP